ncbi:hypothetical protein AsAng_0049220 [Aureispira anguillae]|uniref:Uncharacterized protein n=1 Tax=Aureispira anguillae TaxID=2864201 RepID=A0A915YJ42_9BACT|nr:hypothetical protein AsAng_0049220 [Aureispira anguillae]
MYPLSITQTYIFKKQIKNYFIDVHIYKINIKIYHLNKQ